MAEQFMPALSHFQNNNSWLASNGRLRYNIVPTLEPCDEGEDPEGILTVEVWEGPWERSFSVIEETQTFPLTVEGLAAIPDYLETWRKTVEARPEHTLEENIARRVEPPKK